MDIQQQIAKKLRALPPEKQQEVLEFVDSLKKKNGSPQARRSLLGLWADLDIHLSDQDLTEARRQMWATFPRDVSR